MNSKPSLIILAAGRVTTKLPFFSSLSECPALVPLGVKSSILHQLDFYRNKVSNVIIVTNRKNVGEVEQEIYPEKYKENFKEISALDCKTKNVIKTLDFLIKINYIQIMNFILHRYTMI